ncbi:MerR family transcriptional regulator, partial [Pseudomonas fluorescens ABAC62]
MYIGKAARLSGTTVKTIRHYEDIGLLPPPLREGKYRVYTLQSVELLMFIKCAQQLGFRLKEIQTILQDHRGRELPWDVASQAIAQK